MDADAERANTFLVFEANRAGRPRRWIDRADLDRPFFGVRAGRAFDAEPNPAEQRRADAIRAALQFSIRMNSDEYISHTTAARFWDQPLPALDDPRIHVSTPGRAPRAAGVIGHQVRADMVRVVEHPIHGVRVSDPASTWAMLGGMLKRPYDLVAVGDATVRTPRIPGPYGRVLRPAWGSITDLEAAMNLGRRVGIDNLRWALPRIRAGAASRTETWARLLLIEAGLPEPVLDHDVYDDRGAFIGCVDLAYPELRIAIEYEGDQHRTDPAQWQRDIEKHEKLADAGWRVIRVPRDQLFGTPERYVARVRTVLGARR